jgi:hypothetical protein
MIRLIVLTSPAFIVANRFSSVTLLCCDSTFCRRERGALLGDAAGALGVVQHVELVAGVGQQFKPLTMTACSARLPGSSRRDR